MPRELIRPSIWANKQIAPTKSGVITESPDDILSGIEWFDKFASVPSEKPVTLEALSAAERYAHAASIRQSVINDLKLADRIDPEHRSIVIVEYSEMAAISTRWARAKQVLSSKDAQIGQLTVSVDEQIKELNAVTEAKVTLESRLESLERDYAEIKSQSAEQSTVVADLKATVEQYRIQISNLESELQAEKVAGQRSQDIIDAIKDILGGELPDDSDKAALQDMDVTLGT